MKNKVIFAFSLMFVLVVTFGFVAAANSDGLLQIWRNATTGTITFDKNSNPNEGGMSRNLDLRL